MFYQIFHSPQVKRWAIITYKDGIYQFPHELPNDFRLRKFGDIRKVSKHHRMIAQCPAPPPKKKPSPVVAKTSQKIAIKPLRWRATPHENQSQPQIPRNRLQTPARHIAQTPFRTQSNTYDTAFLQKELTTKTR